ncbi:unnamed protein product [Haemonchus placei]|uniref:DUF148 domain-containing protein n=1 Tax=Haemonchus placei TaxID=6290 RepID=A0A0N4WMG2_HAEPC|nr:unnamed protein product [Haemonchus placei]
MAERLSILLLSSSVKFYFLSTVHAHQFFTLEELHHPPFLHDVSRKARESYYKILFNEKLSIAEQKISEPFQEEVKSLYGKMGKRMEETNDEVAKLIGALPVALKNLTAIMKNENQTMPQMMMALEALKAEHPSVGAKLLLYLPEVLHVENFLRGKIGSDNPTRLSKSLK